MKVIWTTLKKELISYFSSPVAYVIAVLFYLYRGFEVQSVVKQVSEFQLDRDLFSTLFMFQQSSNFMVVLVPPILTMRCFAEERRTGSLEVLMTAPVRDIEVVLGKWFAALSFFMILWLPTLLLLWVLTWDSFLATELSFGPVIAGYLGMSLFGCLLLSVGCFTSSLTDNQLLASLSAMLFNIALLTGALGQIVKDGAAELIAATEWLVGDLGDEAGFLKALGDQLNVMDHLANWFGRGLVDTGQIFFYLVTTCFFLFLTVISLGSRRWR
ncbi:MAG: ABC transporter permease [Planctomycetota bacterium]|nr:ABC transporter permease [Planctomycetota bacterium]